MVDEMVLATQKWLNKTYSGRHGYNTIDEDGQTGWGTVHALLRALQIELGISEPSDNFGSGTTSRYKASPIARPADDSAGNKYAILQGALWCKGYDPGHYGPLDDHYDGSVASAVKSLQADAGVGGDGSSVSVSLMKGLLSMDQYRLVPQSGGDANVRTFQQLLNARVGDACGLVPCDGLYGRGTSRAVVYDIQTLEDMPSSVANGNFGPATRQHCPDLPYSGSQTDWSGSAYPASRIASFGKVASFLLHVNGFPSGIAGDPFPESPDGATIRKFQREYAVPETGIVDLPTWLSLCISCGDSTRKGAACDTRFEITDAHAENLVANGYKYVGRYLTGGDFKQLRDGELRVILRHGLLPFLIFEEGYQRSYFTQAQGADDGAKAAAAAEGYGVPCSATVFFAVDFDALDSDITTNILPYFKAVSENAGMYRVGVYGPRNVCSRVCGAGYAEFSFVSDMSTGFSGNMGYPIPDGWSIDQISTVTITHDGDSLEIDNDLFSGASEECFTPCVQQVPDFVDPFASFFSSQAVDTFAAMTNLSDSSIEVDNTYVDTGGQPAGIAIMTIPPKATYLRRQAYRVSNGKLIQEQPRRYEVIAPDAEGKLVHGYTSEIIVNDGLADQRYPWADLQGLFADWNSDGTSLASSTSVTIKGADYRIFTLAHGTAWVSGADGKVSASGLLQKGQEIALSESAGCGKRWPYRINAKYWRNPGESEWHPFVNRKTGNEVSAFVDMGLQFGNLPGNRFLR